MSSEPSPPKQISYDFQRDVWALFGLPVDNLTMAATKTLLRKKIATGTTTVLSTINVNWVVQSFKDQEFKDTIINSDIVVLDGKPLLWLCKSLGYPLTETVPGSTLIQELLEDDTPEEPLTLFLFGGEDEAGQQAMEQVNQRKGGLRAVGAFNPGFGTMEEMSTPQVINTINKTNPDILLVALGANKGNKWIDHNRHKLKAKVISHLGATINFLGGTIHRAPTLFRSTGTEWLWRIIQEPKLFKRYLIDGLIMAQVILRHFLLWIHYYLSINKFRNKAVDSNIFSDENDQEIKLSFGKNVQLAKSPKIRKLLNTYSHFDKNIVLNFDRTTFADGSFFGSLLLWNKHQNRKKLQLKITSIHNSCKRLMNLLTIPPTQTK